MTDLADPQQPVVKPFMTGQAGKTIQIVLCIELACGGPDTGVHPQRSEVAGEEEVARCLQSLHLLPEDK